MRKYVIALYIRLSLEDYKTDSLSIENQRILLNDFLMTLPESQNAEIMEFVDNGYTGANFERPAMQELLELIRQNRINCVIVKDFTRFGRNSIESGYLIERVFPLFRVRFISVGNNFDTNNYKGDTGGMEVAFQYLISEYYSRDLSVKSKTARYTRMRRGEYQSSICSYGYKKGENGRLAIDEKPAEIVRLIFSLAADGVNASDIARELYRRKIPTPGEYKASQSSKSHYDISRTNGVWCNSTVLRILEDERYTGMYIMGKRTVTEVGSSNSRLKDESLWFKIPDHHPAIVSKDEYNKAKNRIQRFKIPNRKPKQYPLKGKVFCGSCQHALFRNSSTKPHYICRYSKVDEAYICHHLRIYESDLEDMLFEIMEKQAQVILALDSLSDLPDLDARTTEHIQLESQVYHLQECKRELYEKYMLGEISLQHFQEEKSQCDVDLIHAKQLCGTLSSAVRNAQKENADHQQLLKATEDISRESKLTQSLADLLVERVDVYPGNLIDITWKIRDFIVRD